MLVLGRADVERLLPVPVLVDALEAAFRRHAAGRCRVPARASLTVAPDGVLLVMPAGWPTDDGAPAAMGAKLVTVYGGNPARGHPTLHAAYVLLDGGTGEPLAVVEGAALTGLRTGATSALAARHLARADTRRLVCLGTGTQAGYQLRCLTSVLPVRQVAVAGRDAARARRFATSMAESLEMPVEVAGDVRAAVRHADLVTCATTSATPVVFGEDLRPGTHVDAVGAFRPAERELDTEAVRRARVVVDTYDGALAEAGDVLIPLREGAIDRAHLVAELGELVTGARTGRTSADDVTLFKSVGFALEDLAAARLAYERARDAGVGTEVAL